jgi:pilus assembly protein Flp/PilA
MLNNQQNNKFSHQSRQKVKHQSGVTMIEYALIAALISVAAITMLTPIGDAILAKLTVVKVAIVGS